MILKIILTPVLFALIVYAIFQHQRARLVTNSVCLLAIVGTVFLWNPELSNQAATYVGIGRGADLLLYCFVIVTLIVILNLYLRQRIIFQQVTQLARVIAIQGAVRSPRTSLSQGESNAREY